MDPAILGLLLSSFVQLCLQIRQSRCTDIEISDCLRIRRDLTPQTDSHM